MTEPTPLSRIAAEALIASESDQLDLLAALPRPNPHNIVRPTDPDTSHEAAHLVDLHGDRKLVYDAIKANERNHPEGFTRAEIAEIVVLGHVDPSGRERRARVESIRRRVSDFVEVVEETGKRRGREALLRLKA